MEKFELDKEEYSKRTDTVQAYLKKNKLGKYNAEEMAELAREKEEREAEERRVVEEGGIVEGARCEVAVPGKGGMRRGAVRFVGDVHFQPGLWVGVQYDEPTGKNDGSVGGQRWARGNTAVSGTICTSHLTQFLTSPIILTLCRYFTCQNKYGGFVRPAAVQVGAGLERLKWVKCVKLRRCLTEDFTRDEGVNCGDEHSDTSRPTPPGR